MLDDAQLLRRYAEERSEAAFAELVRRHLNLVYFAALRNLNGDRHRAEEVAQSVFTKLADKASALGQRPSLAGWLYLTARFEAGHVARSERRRQARELEAQLMHDADPPPDPSTEWDRLRPMIDDALCALNERDRELVLLRFFQATPFADIGTRFGLTADAVRFRVGRALAKIRRNLTKRGLSSTDAALALALASQADAAAPAGLAATIISSSYLPAVSAPSAAVTVMQFMSTTKIMVGLVVLAGLLAIGFSEREFVKTSHAEAVLAEAGRHYDSSLAQLRLLENRSRLAQHDLENLQQAVADKAKAYPPAGAASVAAPKKSSANPAAAKAPGAQPPINWSLSANPDVRKNLTAWMKANFDLEYGALYKALGFSPDRIEAFETLLLEGNINMNVAWLSLRPDSVSVEDVTKGIRDLLGPADYQAYQDYSRTAFVRRVADALAGNLYYTDAPLQPQQAEQLIQILANSSPQFKQGGYPFPSMVNWETAVGQAQGVLSASQLAAFKNEGLVLASEPGLWAGMNPLNPGSVGNTSAPPASVFAPPATGK